MLALLLLTLPEVLTLRTLLPLLVLGERNTASTDSQNLYLMNSATLFRRSAGYTRRFSRFRNLDQALENI